MQQRDHSVIAAVALGRGAGYCSSNQSHIPMACHPLFAEQLCVSLFRVVVRRDRQESDASIRTHSKQNPGR